MAISPFINRCIRDTLGGLREGLSLFSGESRTALIYAIEKNQELFICDPQNLLRGYEPKLRDIYLDSDSWCVPYSPFSSFNSYNHIEDQKNLQLDGLISHGGSSTPVYYQMWFTEHHPNICSTGPTECWLEHSVLRFSHDIANDSSLYTGISGSFLREYSLHAVHDYCVDLAGSILGLDIRVQVYPMLEAILGISKTNEEGVLPRGAISFIEPRFHHALSFLAKFVAAERPKLTNYKHVRKLLQAVEYSENVLISDGESIIGVCPRDHGQFNVTADFQGKVGFINVADQLICSFHDGNYSSDTHQAKLFEVEETLLDFSLDPELRTDLFKTLAALVHNAEDSMFGCSIVIDLSREPIEISGQSLKPPLDLRDPGKLRLAGSLSKVDGALHIRADMHLHAFACLLDGFRVENEDRGRGARYNSALRFTAQHPETLVVVVSSDRPVSVFQKGQEIFSRHGESDSASCSLYPISLREWLGGESG